MMSRHEQFRHKIQLALLDKQEEAGLPRGSASLWPGTAAQVAADVVMDILEEDRATTTTPPTEGAGSG